MKFEDAIQEIKRRTDIAQIIGRHVKLKRSGRNWMGICPFHQEKTPSFTVRPDRGFFKCFGCGASGDVFSFLEKQSGQSFIDIAQGLAKELNIELETSSSQDAGAKSLEDRLRHALEVAQSYFIENLKNPMAKGALAYLRSERKLGQEITDQWGIGFDGPDDKGLLRYLHEKKVSKEDAEVVGVVREGNFGAYSFFHHRITIPIYDSRKRLVGFGGRIFGPGAEGKPKYINSAQSPLYDKSNVLYGLAESMPLLKKGMPAVLVEGYFDVMAVAKLGFPAVAPCGTNLSDGHIERLSQISKEVVLCFDQDAAGQSAAKKAILALLKRGLMVKWMDLKGKDPDDLVRVGRSEELHRELQTPKDALERLIEMAAETNAQGVSGRIRAISEVMPYLAAPTNPIAIGQYVKYAARFWAEDEQVLFRELGKLNPALPSNRPQQNMVAKERPKQVPRLSGSENLLLQASFKRPDLIRNLEASLLDGLNPVLQNWFEQLATVGRPVQQWLEDHPEMKQQMLDAYLAAHHLSEAEAQEVIADFVARRKRNAEGDAMKQNWVHLRAAEKDGDLDQVKKALKEQSTQLQKWRTDWT